MFGRLIGSVKDHYCKECCSYFIPKGAEKHVLTIGFLTFCLCKFTFEVFLEFFSFSLHDFAKIYNSFCDVDAYFSTPFLSEAN